MATNRRLQAALLQNLGVTPQRLSQRVRDMKAQSGPMSTEDATYVIAHQQGIDLTKFLDRDTVDRVRGLVPISAATRQPSNKSAAKKASRPAQVSISIAGKLPKFDALLSSSIAKDAAKMAQLYPVYYVLENSLRIVIKRILEHKYGKDWWDTKAPKSVRAGVEDRQAREGKKPWHGKRGQHEIFYSDFGDLRSIIERNWAEFEELFPTRHWITSRLDDLEHPRNVMAHHNPVAESDLKRIDVYFHDWTELLTSIKDKIP